MFYIFGIGIAFFLGVLLLGKKDKTLADKILSGWMFLFGVHLLLYYLYFSQKIFDLPFLLGVDAPLPLVHGPCLYLYTYALCRQRLAPKWMLHFLPVLACIVYMFPFLISPAAHKIWVFQKNGIGYEWFSRIKLVAINVSGVVYILWSHRLLRRHRQNIHELFSYEEKINLRWLQYLIFGLAAIWLTVLVGYDPIIFGAAVLFIVFIGYFGIRQGNIFTNQPAFHPARTDPHPTMPAVYSSKTDPLPSADLAELAPFSAVDLAAAAPPSEPPTDRKKYLKSGLNAETAAELHERLLDLMNGQKLFKESELSLSNLAQRLDIHPNYLSQVINEKEGKNFYDYINSLRAAEFLAFAADPGNRRYTLLAMALECGFNSKSAFNRCFKKVTGHPPSAYLQSAANL